MKYQCSGCYKMLDPINLTIVEMPSIIQGETIHVALCSRCLNTLAVYDEKDTADLAQESHEQKNS